MQVKLIVVGRKQEGEEIPIVAREFVIGRGQECDLRPLSRAISRKHCAIIVERDAAAIEDFDSTNGTFVNGERVRERRELASGDRIKIGTWEFDVELGVNGGVKKGAKAHDFRQAEARRGASATAGKNGRDAGRGLDADDDEENVIWSAAKSATDKDTVMGKALTMKGKALTEAATAVLPSLPPLPSQLGATAKEDSPSLLRKGRDEPAQRPKERTAGLLQTVAQLRKELQARKLAEDALRQERRKLEHLLRASDHERQLIAYEIHDGLAQQLAAAIMQLQAYARMKDEQPENAAKAFEAGMALLRQGHVEVRRLIGGVRPPILDESGIVAAIGHLVDEQEYLGGPLIEFRSQVEFGRLDSVLENVIYRIVQEGLTNACKHSQSERVLVELTQQGDRVRIQIRDWGIGFAPAAISDGCFGLKGIRERARLLGGRALMESAPGKGTGIVVDLPLVYQKRPE